MELQPRGHSHRGFVTGKDSVDGAGAAGLTFDHNEALDAGHRHNFMQEYIDDATGDNDDKEDEWRRQQQLLQQRGQRLGDLSVSSGKADEAIDFQSCLQHEDDDTELAHTEQEIGTEVSKESLPARGELNVSGGDVSARYFSIDSGFVGTGSPDGSASPGKWCHVTVGRDVDGAGNRRCANLLHSVPVRWGCACLRPASR